MPLKILFSFLMLAVVTTVKAQTKLSYNGYYTTLPDTLNPFRYYLRFYPDGNVIGYSTAGDPKNLVAWFNKDHKSPSKGQYTLKDSTLSFVLKSEEGNVLYEGRLIQNNHLYFTVKSLINKYEGKEEYFFMQMAGLK